MVCHTLLCRLFMSIGHNQVVLLYAPGCSDLVVGKCVCVCVHIGALLSTLLWQERSSQLYKPKVLL